MVAYGSRFYHPFNMAGFADMSFHDDTTFFLRPSTSIVHHCLRATIFLRVKESIDLGVIDSIILARLTNVAPSGSQFSHPSGMGGFVHRSYLE